jgi:hypothetical protein
MGLKLRKVSELDFTKHDTITPVPTIVISHQMRRGYIVKAIRSAWGIYLAKI